MALVDDLASASLHTVIGSLNIRLFVEGVALLHHGGGILVLVTTRCWLGRRDWGEGMHLLLLDSLCLIDYLLLT